MNDLPEATESSQADSAPPHPGIASGSTPFDQLPSVYHITTWKAGSTWVQGVLMELAPERILVPEPPVADGIEFMHVVPGRIYTPLYVNRPRFDESPFAAAPHRKFVVLRDLRDTLVSCYFSLAKTHGENPVVLMHRRELQAMDKEDGLVYLLKHPDFFGLTMIGSTWLRSTDTLIIRFESLIADPHRWFRAILNECEMEVTNDELAGALERRSFENLAKGSVRTEGVSHYRRGTAGDWKRHFTERIAHEFARLYDDLVIKSGYEPTLGEHGVFQPT